MQSKLFDVMLTLLAGIAMALAGFSLRFAYTANAQIAVLQSELRSAVARTNDARDSAQDVRIAEVTATANQNRSRLWKLKTFTVMELNKLSVAAGSGFVSEPDLDEKK